MNSKHPWKKGLFYNSYGKTGNSVRKIKWFLPLNIGCDLRQAIFLLVLVCSADLGADRSPTTSSFKVLIVFVHKTSTRVVGTNGKRPLSIKTTYY